MTSKPIALAVLASVACNDPDPVPPDATPIERIDVMTIKAVQNPDLDLLFVIDDSGSMATKQGSFTRAFPALVAQLASIDGGIPNLHVGVISPDMGTKGSAVEVPGPMIGAVGNGGCAGVGKAGNLLLGRATLTSGKFMRLGRDGSKNFAGTFEDTFTQLASLGAGGCGFEQPLHAIRRALVGNTENTGFQRSGANLAVVVLSDEDDCSALDPDLYQTDPSQLGPLQSFRCFRFGVQCTQDTNSLGAKTECRPRVGDLLEEVAPTADFLLARTEGDKRRLMFGAIVGDPGNVVVEERTINQELQTALAPSCTYQSNGFDAVADAPVRLAALADTFQGTHARESICSDDLSSQATAIGKSIKRLVGDPCLPRALIGDCIVVDKRDSEATERQLPSCADGGDTDCFDVIDDATRCVDGPKQRLSIRRSSQPADDLWTTVRCTQ